MSFVKGMINYKLNKKISSNCKHYIVSKSLHIFHPSGKQLFKKKMAQSKQSMQIFFLIFGYPNISANV